MPYVGICRRVNPQASLHCAILPPSQHQPGQLHHCITVLETRCATLQSSSSSLMLYCRLTKNHCWHKSTQTVMGIMPDPPLPPHTHTTATIVHVSISCYLQMLLAVCPMPQLVKEGPEQSRSTHRHHPLSFSWPQNITCDGSDTGASSVDPNASSLKAAATMATGPG